MTNFKSFGERIVSPVHAKTLNCREKYAFQSQLFLLSLVKTKLQDTHTHKSTHKRRTLARHSPRIYNDERDSLAHARARERESVVAANST